METKVCTKCGQELPATTDFFYKANVAKDGLKSHCKVCAKAMNKENHARNYKQNKVKINAKNTENYYKRNPKETIPDGHKKCSVCGKIKSNENFGKRSKSKDGLRGQCKTCREQEYQNNREAIINRSKLNYENNKEKVNEVSKAYREKNAEMYRTYNKKYYQENMEVIKENSKKSLYRRIETEPGFKVLQRLRKRMYEAVKGNVKSARTIELIGCSVESLREHLERQFTEGMNWENYGAWHVDHIIPCASFDFTKPEEQLICFNYTNLQPLWAVDNIRKSNKLL